MDLADIDMNDGDERDILGITLNMCDFIEERWKKLLTASFEYNF